MTIDEVRQAEKIGEVMTVEDFMDCVHSHGFIPDDGCGVFVFKTDTEIPSPWSDVDRSVWSVLEPITKPCKPGTGDWLGFNMVDGKMVINRADYRTVDRKLPDGLKDKIECVCWYNK